MVNILRKIRNYFIKSNDIYNKLSNNNFFNNLSKLVDLKPSNHVFSSSQVAKEIFFHGDLELIEKLDSIINGSDNLINSCLLNKIEFLFYSSEEERLYFKNNEGTVIMTDFYYWIMLEIFSQKLYTIPPQIQKRSFEVIDIGMNRGYSPLWFAQDQYCKAVYAFEIDKDTYRFAIDNINLNSEIANKIKTFDFGLAKKSMNLFISYIPGEDGVTTINGNFINSFYTDSRKKRIKKKRAVTKNASQVVNELLLSINQDNLLILKIDVEGAEEEILEDLYSNHLISKFSIIFGECHNGMDELKRFFKEFKLVNLTKKTNLVYNFCYIRK